MRAPLPMHLPRRPRLPLRGAGNGRRGSAILVVLSVLSVLVLLAVTLAYTSRIEVLSARNFGTAVENRMQLITVVSSAAARFEDRLPKDALSPLHLEPRSATLKRSGTQVEALSPALAETLAWQDASSLLNLNTASEAALRRLLDAVAESKGLELDSATLAARVAAWRLGDDGAPGVRGLDDDRMATRSATRDQAPKLWSDGRSTPALTRCAVVEAQDLSRTLRVLETSVDDPAEYVADLRLPAHGDDRRFQGASQLLEIQGFTPEVVEALTPLVTVFSVSSLPALEEGVALADINHASAAEIRAALEAVYGNERDGQALAQFAANIVDARDADSIPTRLEGPSGPVFGLERIPFLTEVYADSRSADEAGDDGQFVEIHNPWNTDLSLSGWALRVAGRDFALVGTLPAGGFLIVTDDYDNSRDREASEDASGEGSFYDVFGAASNGSSRRVLEVPELSLPHQRGTWTVDLKAPSGALADRIEYRVTEELSTRSSFQRQDLPLGSVRLLAATPFQAPQTRNAQRVEFRSLAPLNRPFVSLTELFSVFAGVATREGAVRWGFPEPVSPASSEPEARQLASNRLVLDARVVDALSCSLLQRASAEAMEENRRDVDANGRLNNALNAYEAELPGKSGTAVGNAGEGLRKDVQAAQSLAWDRFAGLPAGFAIGRANLNTAPLGVLRALGLTEDQARGVLQRRYEAEQRARRHGTAQGSAVFGQLSDVLVDASLWGKYRVGEPCDRLEGFAALEQEVTLGSRAFLVEGSAEALARSGQPSSRGARIQALVAMDRENPEVVQWRFVP